MNILKTYTVRTARANTFNVYWTNSDIRPGGLLKVQIKPDIPDRMIAAELSAIQYLLEDKCVLGNTVISGQGIKLVISQGAIRKLHGKRSNKSHLAPYSNFLVTRFADCQIEVSKKVGWFTGCPVQLAEHLLITGPRRETLNLAGLGEVSISSHVLERFAERLLPDVDARRKITEAWKKLIRVASDPSLHEVARRNRNAPMRFTRPGHREGRYFLNRAHNLLLVVADRPHEGKRLVTIYPAANNFVAQPKAA